MKTIKTRAIVLRRTNYGEADRVITALTDRGKITFIAKGSRRLKSKLASGIELLAENQFHAIDGSGAMKTIISSKVNESWQNLIKEYYVLQEIYQILKYANQLIEDEQGEELFEPMRTALAFINEDTTRASLGQLWFYLRLMHLGGHTPELLIDNNDEKLRENENYSLDKTLGRLIKSPRGKLSTNHIKLWRIALTNDLELISKIKGTDKAATESIAELKAFVEHFHGD